MLRLLATILLASVAVCRAAENAAGSWEGSAQIPGQELKLVVDLSDQGALNGVVYFESTDGNLYSID